MAGTETSIARAEVRAAVELQVGGRRVRHGDAVEARRPFDRVDHDRVRQRAGLVVVLGRLVRRRGDHGDAVVVGVVDRFAREHRVVEAAEGLLHDVDAAVGRVDRRLAEAVGLGDERLADAQRQHLAVRARADLAGAVVRFGGGVLVLAGAVAVLHLVVGVVVVVDEVPAGDVVGVAVVVVVDAVGEGDDQILRREHAGRAVAAFARRRRVGAVRIAFDDVRHARVAGVVEHVEHALFEHVVGDRAAAARRASGHAAVGVVVAAARRARRRAVDVGGGVERRGEVDFRRRQLADVEHHLGAQLGHVAGVVPLDARVELADRDVRAPDADLEGRVERRAGGDARAGSRRHRRVRVDQAHPRDAAQLVLLRVVFLHVTASTGFGTRRLRGRGELPRQPADVARQLPRRELPARRVAGTAAAHVGERGQRRAGAEHEHGRDQGGGKHYAPRRAGDEPCAPCAA